MSFRNSALQKYQQHIAQGRERVARVMMADLYTDEERRTSNCRGLAGKPALDPLRMIAIHEAVFMLMPCQSDIKDTAWSDCMRSIDAFNREFRKKKQSATRVTMSGW